MNIDRGTRLGPYEVVSRIGAGGMGVVWEGRDTRLDRSVAIKVLPSEFSANVQLRLRFEREAKAISSLNHPHICTLFDVGYERDGALESPYLVMELLDGESLADRLTRGPLPLEQVLRYGSQIALALEAAHRQGIVHRDLKPGNVILTRSGAKLLDFGLAKGGGFVTSGSFGGDSPLGEATAHKPLTEEGTMLGTFQYMAPEQLEGLEADPRTDIFALGALLYEMTTGRRPFQAASRTSLIAAIVSSEPPPISTINPITPPALEHVVKRCMQKSPDDRWQSSQDVAGELLWIAEAGSQAGVPVARTVRRRTRERLAWTLGAIFLLLAVAAGGWALAQIGDTPRTFRSAVMPPDGVRIPLVEDSAWNAVPSPDGTKITYRGVDEQGNGSLYVHDLISGDARTLPDTADAQYPFWSPDSRWVGFFSQSRGALLKVDTAGGSPVRITTAINGKGGSWNREGQILFTPDFGSAISVVPASGGESREVTRLDVSQHNSHRHPRFLPDGKRFLFLARSVQPGRMSSVMLGSLGTTEAREIIQSDMQAEYAGNSLLFVRGTTLMSQPFNSKRGALEGEAQPVAEGTVTLRGASFAAISASSNGLIVYQTSKPRPPRPFEWRSRDGELIATLEVKGEIRNVAVSPSGKSLAASISTPDGDTDIWIIDAEGGVSRRLPSPGEDLTPVWSLDETSVYFASNPRGRFGLYRRSIESDRAAETILEMKDDLFPAALTPEGEALLMTRGDARPAAGSSFALDLLRLESKALTPLLEDGFAGAVSPDARWIAWTVLTGDSSNLFVARWPGVANRRQIASNVSTILWHRGSGGAAELLYVDRQGKLFSTTLDTATPPHEIPTSGLPQAVSHDGSRILTIAPPKEPPTSTIRVIQHWNGRR